MTLSVPEAASVPRASTSGGNETPAELAGDRIGIERSLERVGAAQRTRLAAVARHHLAGGGKRVRPLLTCAVMRALGEDPERWLDLIAAVEMVHTGSLLHDDVIDGAQTRRGRRAAHLVFDAHAAILAGDSLLSWAFERVAREGSRELQIALGEAVCDLGEGEALERERLGDDRVEVAHVRRVNRLKTASLFAYAAEAGAILCGASSALRAAARGYGLGLGEAFQTTDDLLDWTGDGLTLGKPPGQDLEAGLVTVPVALGLDRHPGLREEIRAFWERRGQPGGAARVAAMRARLEAVGALSATLALAEADAARATAALEPFPPSPWVGHLGRLAEIAASRDA